MSTYLASSCVCVELKFGRKKQNGAVTGRVTSGVIEVSAPAKGKEYNTARLIDNVREYTHSYDV